MAQDKQEIRKELLRRLRDQNPSLREDRSSRIQEKFLATEEYKVCETVMTYVPLPTEVDTKYIMHRAKEQGKRVVVPLIGTTGERMRAVELTSMDQLRTGPYGIQQPDPATAREVPLEKIEVIAVPAIAYDKQNMRLGRGKGYYDRFLSSPELSGAATFGLAFAFQVLSRIPFNSHDRPVDRVLTEETE